MNLRSFILGIFLLGAIVITYVLAFGRPTPAVPSQVSPVRTDLKYTYLIDVAGWYEITPNESAVASPYDYSIDGLKALPDRIGQWVGSPLALGSEVDQWFENPDLALSSFYHGDKNHQLWFSLFGSKSRKSYSLFEHTPATSYPAAGWTLERNSIRTIAIEGRKIAVQEAVLSHAKERRIAYYWYLWNDFGRDPEKGVLTMRLHIPVVSTDDEARAAGEDFLRSIFPQVVSWRRF